MTVLNGAIADSPNEIKPPTLNATLVQLNLAPLASLEAFPITLETVDAAFQTNEVMELYAKSNRRVKELNSQMKAVSSAIIRLNKQIDDREDEIRIDPTYEAQLAGPNEPTRKAKLAKVLKEDPASKALQTEARRLLDERDMLAAELEGLQGDIKMYQTFSAQAVARMHLSVMAIAAPQAAAAYLAPSS
jgi:hypothetical protein